MTWVRLAALAIFFPLLAQESVPPREMLRTWLSGIAMKQLAARRDVVDAIRTRDQLSGRQRQVRDRLLEMIGGLPEPSRSLKVQRTGKLDRGDYRVEKLIFEGQPGMYVTANLYMPNGGQPPYPAVLHSVGHSTSAKNRAFYQTLSIGLVKHGFVVLTIDPLGQGERRIFYDRDLQDSKVGGTTVEHEMVGLQSLLAGESIARQFIRDGMRGIDLLESLPEVDRGRIGITGCSGGGTLTTYLAVLDPRVAAAAPACYITSWEEQLRDTGPQDAEQQFPDLLANRLDHADYVVAFAPKPYLICSTDQDFFPLEGARRTFAESKRMWELAGSPDRIDWFHEPGGHGMPQATREAIYGWMKHWLQNGPTGPAAEPAIQTEYEADLNATPTGQLATSVGGETASTSNLRRFRELPKPSAKSPEELRDMVLRVTRAELGKGQLNMRRVDASTRKGYRLEHIVYDSGPGRYVPAMLASPEQGSGRAILYAGDDAASSAFAPGGDLDTLASVGYTVLAIDVAGRGETTPTWQGYSTPWFGKAHKTAWLGLMVGRPLVGLQIEDIVRGLDLLGRKDVIGFGKGGAAVDMLHAAVVDPRLSALALEQMLVSYRALATSPVHRQLADVVLPGVLSHYDLPELAAATAPRKVWLLNVRSPAGGILQLQEVRAAYVSANVRSGLRRESDSVLNAWPELR